MRLESSLQTQYLDHLTHEEEEFFHRSKAEALARNKEKISLSTHEGQILGFMVRSFQCQKFVEIGTLTGFSALFILKNLAQGGTLWTFEKESELAQWSRSLLSEASQSWGKSVEVLEGDAEIQLLKIQDQGPFDGIFIDGNKAAYGRYLDWAEKNIRTGGLIVADNVFLEGSVWGETREKFSSKQVQVMKEFNARLKNKSLFSSCWVPTFEGLAIAQKIN